MSQYAEIVNDLVNRKTEEEWFEFKENWFDAHGLGEYISALSNAAALCKRDKAYLVWGIDDETHEIVGTKFNFRIDVNKEPLELYLARQVSPDIAFSFNEMVFVNKRLVILEIPCAKNIPTAFDGNRYLRIGSSKVNLNRYQDREGHLFEILRNKTKTIENLESNYQDLSFSRLFTYYAGRGISLKLETFKKNLGLLTKDGKYNLMAQLLSDDSHIPVRVSVFSGETKASPLYSVKEFGNICILLSLDRVLEYGEVINIIQADETNRVVSRNDVPLFDMDAFREALVNAFVHNKWIDGNAPMITIYSNRVEILSRGTIPDNQTIDDFYMGESIPVNEKLSEIFLQLHISERSGRGVPKIIESYGKNAFDFRKNSIAVNIPFNWINKVKSSIAIEAQTATALNATREKILAAMRNNPNIKREQIAHVIGLKISSIDFNIRFLKEHGYIERIGSKKSGYWKVKEV